MILVGEMRDLETISTALTAAETGHLVFATLHTQDTAQTIDRIIDVFPAHQQGQVRVQLSVALQGIMTQQLLPTADGSGPRRGDRGARAHPGGAQPDPRGQDPPDLLGPADRLRARHADDGRLAGRARARRQDHARSSPNRAPRRPRSCGACWWRGARRTLGGRRRRADAMSTYVFKAMDLAGVKAKRRGRGRLQAGRRRPAASARGLIVLDIGDKHASREIELELPASASRPPTWRSSRASSRR